MLRSAAGSPLDGADDRTLAGRAADGDVVAFEVIVRRHGPLMRAFARRILGSSEEVDDVVQETFITAWQQLPTLADPSALKSWLMRTVSRRCVDRIRVRRPHDDVDDHDPPARTGDDPQEVLAASSLGDALSRALARLPDRERAAWLLKEVTGASYGEIARELAVPTTTVRGLLARARRTLMTELEEWR